MEKELFDKAMENRGWIPNGKAKMALASTKPSSPDDHKKSQDLYRYCHKCGMTISVDDEEIKGIQKIDFSDWYEVAAAPYFESRLYAFCQGKRVITHDGEYITAECTTESFMNMQIDRLCVQDDYILKKKSKRFSFSRLKKIHSAVFHKPRPKPTVLE